MRFQRNTGVVMYTWRQTADGRLVPEPVVGLVETPMQRRIREAQATLGVSWLIGLTLGAVVASAPIGAAKRLLGCPLAH